MKFKYTLFSAVILLFLGHMGFSEGTKELMPDVNNPTRLLLEPSSGRVPFALYSSRADSGYRLVIHIQDPVNERIYFGFGQQRNSNNTAINTRITWRIHPPNLPDEEECIGQTPIAATPAETGYITSYLEATNGPNVINASGYLPFMCTPTHGAGDYFMTFEATAARTFDFADITVVNISTTPYTAVPGRVYSRCWQLRNPSSGGGSYYNFYGLLYVYSSDGIVTKMNPNGMEGRDFAISCNESGCYKILNPPNAQEARQSQPGPTPHTYPQYKIFLNDPDNSVYPDGVIGRLVPGSVTTETYCNTGTVNFNFQTTPVNAVGSLQIILSLSTLTPPLVDRILVVNNVPGGNYTITWDGLDGSGVQVPSGSTFPFTLRYTNGLTHMPL